MTGACVLVPMKRFAAAKSRLGPRLDDAARARLAGGMFERVLGAAQRCELVQATYVLTNGDDVASRARAAGAEVLLDPAGGPCSLGDVVDRGLACATQLGASRAVILMADLPLITELDVAELCAALTAHDLVAAPDRRGRSTNALGVRLPFPAPTAFGHRDSYMLHLVRARALRLRVCELARPRLAHDVDIPEDLQEAGVVDLLRSA